MHCLTSFLVHAQPYSTLKEGSVVKPPVITNDLKNRGDLSKRQYGYLENGQFTPMKPSDAMALQKNVSPTKRRYDPNVGDPSDATPKPSPGKKKKMEFVEGDRTKVGV